MNESNQATEDFRSINIWLKKNRSFALGMSDFSCKYLFFVLLTLLSSRYSGGFRKFIFFVVNLR